MLTALPTLTISTIFMLWHALRRQADLRERKRIERLAFLIWRAAHHDEGNNDDEPSSESDPPEGEDQSINATEIRLFQYTLPKKK